VHDKDVVVVDGAHLKDSGTAWQIGKFRHPVFFPGLVSAHGHFHLVFTHLSSVKKKKPTPRKVGSFVL